MAGATGDAVNEALSEWLVVALISFSLIFQFSLHQIESWVRRRHPHLEPVMHMVYRELMVLGLVSILFLMYTQLAHPKPTAVHSFEFAHVFIFALAIFFVAAVMCALAASLRLSVYWKSIEHVALPHYRALKTEYTALRLRMHSRTSRVWRVVGWWLTDPRRLSRFRFLHETLAFHDLRFQIIFFRRLPDDFRFSAFLRRIKGIYFVDLVEPHYSLWILFLAAMLGDLVRRYASGDSVARLRTLSGTVRANDAGSAKDAGPVDDIAFREDVVGSAMLIAFALALIVIVQVLALKIRLIYWHLTKNPRIYYAHVHAVATSPLDLSQQTPGSLYPSTTLPGNNQNPISLTRANPHDTTPILSHPTAMNAIRPNGDPAGSGQSLEGQIWDDVERQPQAEASATGDKARPGVSFCDSTVVESAVTGSNASKREEKDLEAGAFRLSREWCADEVVMDREKLNGTGVHTGVASSPETQEVSLQNELLKHKSLAVKSPTLAKNREDVEQAREIEVKKYPWIVTKLIPRLGRVASAAEKLFWFGSHHLFFWCVQFSLFFSTVAMSASTASVLLRLFNNDAVTSLDIAALVVSVVCLLFVQLRVAFMLKKYVFVLVSASLLPEDIVKRTVRDLRHKRVIRVWDQSHTSEEEILEEEEILHENDEEDENEGGLETSENQSALQNRKTIGRYFREEAERGNMPGVSGNL
ncbi:hypothetical protein BWQ96_09848 [Gracilariopsis chorda]|uniref:MLO-like protein n=1 Tax=Gracilariopsis chorda TaxID=448386 RepID=A0A2V3IEF2_9FLOR|nr:hypothetical protein BWQ96_09848 [Gracilariopsis chorda]|eukprot:PXF40443.1 hypothetical protein BWQ96_09848 [Gracilariopsis chorda]